ncbi:MAG: HAMP domain-containing protein, partial [Candidatus Riflebacteria bacterium]|nr:HAMP domain-containing protein [Candidatus Riflebacteria bacterium]
PDRAAAGRPSAAAALGSLGIFQQNRHLVPPADVAQANQLGERHTMRYANLVFGPRGTRYVLILIWNQESLYADYLRETIAAANAAAGPVTLVAFRRTPEKLVRLGGTDQERGNDPAARSPELGLLARQVRGGRMAERVDGRLLLAMPSRRMPGFILGAVASTAGIARELAREDRLMWGAILLILGLVGAAAWGLERWLARPLVRMAGALGRVADNQLDTRIGEDRADELGEAGRTLDQMTRWLKERQMVSRFVSPKVLEAVAGGDLTRATRAQTRELALLVSDVRSFTTMSEAHPPDRIFALINRHIQIMTSIIQEHGGVIDRFIGDAIQAVFFPGADGDMVDRPLRAAAAMMEAHRAYNRERQGRGEFPYQVGIGVEVGEVVTGVLGDPDVRLDFTVMGEPFKHAADLEACSKSGRALKIVVSPEVKARAAASFRFLPLRDPAHPDLWELAEVLEHAPAPEPASTHGPASSPGQTFATKQASPAGPPATAGLASPPGPAAAEAASPRGPAAAEAASPRGPTAAAGAASPPGQAAAAGAAAVSEAPARPAPASLPEPATGAGAEAAGPVPSHPTSPLPPPHSPSSRLALVPFLAIWLVPVALGIGFLQVMESSWLEARAAAVLSRLQDRLAIVERTLEPQVQAGLLLRQTVRGIEAEAAAAPPGRFGPTLETAVRSRLRDFTNACPSAAWFLFRHQPNFGPDGRMDATATILLATGGSPLEFGGTGPDEVFDPIKCKYLSVTDSLPKGRTGQLETLLGIKSFTNLMEQSFLRFSPVQVGGRARWLLWAPFHSPTRVEGNPPGFEHGLPYQWARDHAARLWGGLLLLVEPADLTPDLGVRALVRLLGSEGFTAAVLPETGSVPAGWVHPGFLRYPALARTLTATTTGTRERVEGFREGFAVTQGRVFPAQECRILLAREADDEGNPYAVLRPFLRVVGLLWIGGGLWVLAGFRRTGHLPFHSVLWQLGGAFLLTIGPALALGALFTGRSLHEERLRFETGQARRLERALQAMDESRTMHLACCVSLLERICHRPDVLRRLLALEDDSSRRARRAAERLLAWIDRTCSRRGYSLNRLLLFGPGRMRLDFRMRSEGNQPVITFFGHVFAKALRVLNPTLPTGSGARGQADDLIFGLGAEEVRLFMSTLMAPETMAEMTMAPRAVVTFASIGRLDSLFRSYIWSGGFPRFALQMLVYDIPLEFQSLNGWRERLRARGDPIRLVGRTDTGVADFLYRPKFWRVAADTDSGAADYHGDLILTDPDDAAMLSLADQARIPVSRLAGVGPAEELRMALRGGQYPDRLLLAALPLGRLRADLEWQATTTGGLLAVLILLAGWLAVSIARRFLAPVESLRQEAGRIMQGDFTARLVTDRGGEFGALARAFNRMAAGVEEGRLLSRFVSESVRVAAADDERGRAAQAGENLEVTVIFAGLADFKSLLAGTDPVAVVGLLNRYLEAMSRVIRQYGGDIDKFIGDKILAVFHPERLGGDANAAIAATRAAAAMRARMAGLAAEDGGRGGAGPWAAHPLGVGIVTGPVLSGIMGTPEVRLEHTVIGDTVNLASRLGDLSVRLSAEARVLPDTHGSVGGVVLEARTFELVRASSSRFLTEDMAPLELPPIKGKTRSVTAFVYRPGQE